MKQETRIKRAIDKHRKAVEAYIRCSSPYNFAKMREAAENMDQVLTAALKNPETLKNPCK